MKKKLLILVLLLQSIWIVGTSINQERLLKVGHEILLETQPVDPRDPLRGDFVRLNYQISSLTWTNFAPPLQAELSPGKTVFVAVAPKGTNGYWSVTRASLVKMAPATNEVIIRGKCQWNWNSGLVRVEYGLEKYFVAEGTGNPRGKLTVLAAVSDSGKATIKQVFLDGVPYAEAMRSQHP